MTLVSSAIHTDEYLNLNDLYRGTKVMMRSRSDFLA